MPNPTLTLSSTTSIAATIAVSGFAADGTLEIQAGIRPDFQNCVAPIITGLPRTSPATITGLTQDTPYYVRARSKRASGAYEDWSPIIPARTALVAGPDLSTPAILISPAMFVIPAPILEWTGDNDIAGYPCLNLGFDAPVPWRSTPAGGVAGSFLVRMAPQPIDTLALLMSNVPEAATVQIKAGNTTATTDYTATTVPFRASANLAARPGYHSLVKLPAPQSYPYWRVNIAFAGGLTGPLHIEHAIFGFNRVSKNHSVDKGEAPLDLGSYERGRTGIPQRTIGLRGKRVDFEISMLNQLQYETLYGDISRLVGATLPVLVVPNARSGTWLHDRILYGVLTGGKTTNHASPVFSRAFSIDSILP